MPNQRAEGQKLLPIAAKEEFINELDANLNRVGYSNRSQFIRDAILEKLAGMGIKLPKELALAPDRTESKTRYTIRTHHSPVHQVSSKSDAAGKRVLKKAAASIVKPPSK